jgi:hypothetical protein
MSDFCVYISTYQGDFFRAKILCASIRYFLGDVPILVFKDGDFGIEQLQRLGNIREFDDRVIAPQARIFKGHYARIKAFFNPDYERFLYLDADTLLIGNILQLPFRNSDILVNPGAEKKAGIGSVQDADYVERFFLNLRHMPAFDPEFVHDGLVLFNSGQFFARPFLFPLEAFLAAYHYHRVKPARQSAIPFTDQSILNYVFNKAAQQGEINLAAHDFVIFPWKEDLDKYPDLTRDAVVNKMYSSHYLLHYIRPLRHTLLSQHGFSDLLHEFSRRYDACLPLTHRLYNKVERLVSIARQGRRSMYARLSPLLRR